MVGRDHVRGVLDGPRAIDERPPVHGLRGAPRVHVRTHAHQHLGTVERQLPDGLGKEPVVADRAADPADRRVGDREERQVEVRQVMRARVHFPGNPGIHLAVGRGDAVGPDEHRRVEDRIGPAWVPLEERARLDPASELLAHARVGIGVLVGELDGKVLLQFLHRQVARGRVRELGERDQAHVEEGFVAADGRLGHRAHAGDAIGDGTAVLGRLERGLDGGGVVPHGAVLGAHARGSGISCVPRSRAAGSSPGCVRCSGGPAARRSPAVQ